MRMLGNRVLLQKLKTENKTKGGIILTSPEKERVIQCKVISVGPSVTGIEPEETVLVDSYKMTKINDNFFCDFADVVGVVE